MSSAKSKKFFPHLYADHLTRSGRIASDGLLLYSWTETHWAPLDDVEAEREAYLWLVRQDEAWATPDNARKAVRAACLYAPKLPSLTEEVVIPTLNGYVHLEDAALVLKPAEPALGVTHCLACSYVPEGAEAPRFQQFLEMVLPDPRIRLRVQEYVGYTLMADARYQRAQLWLGEGANGKGVLANIVQALHGRTAAVALDQLAGFRLSGLVGASLIYVDEVPRKRVDEQTLKSLIAGERVAVDRKNKEIVSVPLRGKWLVLGNHLPAVSDHSPGFWRRWDLVPFSVTIPERHRDAMLAKSIIRTELSGVLTWALSGLQRLQQRGGFDPEVPTAMKAMLHEAKADTNSVVAWVDADAVELQITCDTPKDRVFEHYRRWCTFNAMREVSVVQFWKRMREHFKELEGSRNRVDGVPTRMCNVRLTVPLLAQ